MKASVIFGVLHMSFGIITKGMNLAYEGKSLEIYTEVLTGLTILLGLFGWMDLQIFLKWFANPDIDDISKVVQVKSPDNSAVLYQSYETELKNSNMPSIISVLINSMLNIQVCREPSTPEDAALISYLGANICTVYSIATILLVFVIISVPVMLCVKPCIVYN